MSPRQCEPSRAFYFSRPLAGPRRDRARRGRIRARAIPHPAAAEATRDEPSRPRAARRIEHFPALPRHAKGRAEDRLRRGRAEADEHFRPNEAQLRFHPRPAGGDVARVRLLMDAAFPARLPFEMLHRVRDVNRVAIDPGFLQRAIEHLARRARRTVSRSDLPGRPVARRGA